MTNLPTNWQVKSLGDVAEFLDSQRIPVKEEERAKRIGPYPYYGANGQVGWIDDYIFDEPLVLLAEDGGNFGSKDKPIAYKISGKSWVNNHAHVLRATKNCNLDYLHRALSFYDLSQYLTGTTRQKLRKGDAERISIPLPPLPIQKQIAEILEQADKAKQKRKEANKLSDEFLQSVFIEMFGDPVKNPKGWVTKSIVEISKVGTGGTPSRKNPEYFTGNIPWVKTTEVNNNRIFETEEKITDKALSESNCTMFSKGTVLIALYGQGLTRGRASILEIEACTNQACAAILPSKKINSIFLWQQLLHFYNHLRSLSRGGNQPNLNLSFIKNLNIIIPSLTLQQQFAEIVNKTEELKEKQKQSEQKLENLFQSLMQRAFKGELV